MALRHSPNGRIGASLAASALFLPLVLASGSSCASLTSDIETVVVIYAENRSFDNLYGLFPGAKGIGDALKNPDSYRQLDRNGSVLPNLPGVWTASDRQKPAWAFVAEMPNAPFQIDAQPGGTPGADADVATPDLVHRFYNNQMQIDGGRNNRFAAWSDAGGLSMGYYDGSPMKVWKLAERYTLADNFFQGAFGGSFLNHFWLVCACTPTFPDAPASAISKVDADGVSLAVTDKSPASALDGAPIFAADKNVTPDFYAVNTTQPSYQPSGAPPAAGGDPRLADPAKHPLPPQTLETIGDTLSAKGIPWAWYAGAWNAALADRANIYNKGVPNFQPHHQPFNYFARFDPTTPKGRAERAKHLKDYTDLVKDIRRGKLPAVTFYKPQGDLNQHPGYTDIMSGDEHIADLIAKLQAGPQWKHMAIIVTYDENGGFFDHVAPPKGDRWGPGTRIPTLVISPYARKGYVDHTYYDTTSIPKFITKRFNLDPLPGVRAAAGDLTPAFSFSGK